jgi:hypothetical protein
VEAVRLDDLPDLQLDPPEDERQWCRHCGFDPSCDCEPEEPEDCPATMRDGELYECVMTETEDGGRTMSKPTNTAALSNDELMVRTLCDGRNIIENMEARGARELVASESLPTKCSQEDDDLLVSWGFEFGEPFADDPMFRPARLPPGWSKRATDHSMWAEVVDDDGHVRISIFYKAAFYDRSAHMHLNPRYDMVYAESRTEHPLRQIRDEKTGVVLFETSEPNDYSPNDPLAAWAREHIGADWTSPKRWDDP